ncbi:MAG: xanthine dehydrogenase family protein molybdopterin-binding subunit [Acidobacteria bacterium]|nr:xanthine dehydrogenase family protein molybdopterin-binding subunit [Acidobacteriota bacterium]
MQEDVSRPLPRRDFLKLLGPGLYIIASADGLLVGQPFSRPRGYPEDFNAYLRIAGDGGVTCFAGKVELGQGVVTSLAQLLAEELEVPFSSVKMVLGDTALCPWDAGTNGSRSIKILGPVLRAAGAEAREVLIQLAAEHLKSPAERLRVEDGVVFDPAHADRRVGYGTLVRGTVIERRLGHKPGLKAPEHFRVCGRSLARPDFRDKVTGRAAFSADIRIDRMLYGRVVRPPAHGARLERVDTTAAGKVPGAEVFVDGDFIGVVHPEPDMAERAAGLVEAEYAEAPSGVNERTIHERILGAEARDTIVEEKGEIGLGERESVRRFEAVYLSPYVAHAPLETHSALADVREDGATVWVGTQRPFGADQEIGRVLGMAPEKVRIITPWVGGGFGGKSQVGQAVEAARLSRMARRPVQVAWTREEEFFYDTFQPAAAVRIRSGLDARHRIAFWDCHVLFAGDRSSENIYDVPHVRTLSRGSAFGGGGPHPFPTGAWRGPGSNSNIFARESHIDEMAAAAGMDPLGFRLHNLKDERMVRVVRAAAEKFGWGEGRPGGNRGRGMACLDYLGTYVCVMGRIRLEREGRIVVEKVVLAQDMGPVINPEGARMQIEGAVTMGLGYCLSEEIRFEGGRILDLGFGTYRIPRFSWVPEIECVLVDNQAIPSSGCGEPPIVGMGAMMANALSDAAGVRIRRLPLTPERVRAALP